MRLSLSLRQCFERRLEAIGGLDSDDEGERGAEGGHPSHEPHAPPQGWPPATSVEVHCSFLSHASINQSTNQ